MEVAPFAYAKVLQNLVLIGSQNPALRMGKAKAGPVVSDNGNFIIDAPFSAEDLKDPLRVSFLPLALHLAEFLTKFRFSVDFEINQDVDRRRRGRLVLSYGSGRVLRERGTFPSLRFRPERPS